MRRLLVLHGWTNRRPPDHWQRRLVAARRAAGDVVAYPQLPNTDQPVLADWVEVATTELALLEELPGAGERVVVAHSLGCVLWLHLCHDGLVPTRVDRVLLVAPAAPEVLGELPDFAAIDLVDPTLHDVVVAAAGHTLLVGSDGDPWTPRGLEATFAAPLGLPLVTLPGAAHLALSDGFGPWQGVVDWVADPATADLSAR